MKIKIIACACLLGFATAVTAADPKPPEIVSLGAPFKPQEPLNINVDFAGGSIDQFLTAVNKTEGISLSIVSAMETPDFTRVELPAFALRNVTLFTITQVLVGLMEPRGYNLNFAGAADPNTMVAVLQKRETPRKMTPVNGEFLSFQLTPYLADQSVDDIVSAIRTAWELDPAHEAAELRVKFHPGTGLLLVSGPPEAIYLTQSVLGQLKRKPDPKPAAAAGNPPPPAKP